VGASVSLGHSSSYVLLQSVLEGVDGNLGHMGVAFIERRLSLLILFFIFFALSSTVHD
jgi:hypothetical protein